MKNTDRQIWILTNYGLSRITEVMESQTTERLFIDHIKIGDANGSYYIPEPSKDSLRNLIRDEEGNPLKFPISKKSVEGTTVSFHTSIDETLGGYDIREIGLYETVNGQDHLFALGTCEPIVKPAYDEEGTYGYLMSIDFVLNITSTNLSSVYDKIILNPDTEYIKKEELEALSKTVLFVEGNLMEQISNNTHILGLNRAQQLSELIESTRSSYADNTLLNIYGNVLNSTQSTYKEYDPLSVNKIDNPVISAKGILTASTAGYVSATYLNLMTKTLVSFNTSITINHNETITNDIEIASIHTTDYGKSLSIVQKSDGNIYIVIKNGDSITNSTAIAVESGVEFNVRLDVSIEGTVITVTQNEVIIASYILEEYVQFDDESICDLGNTGLNIAIDINLDKTCIVADNKELLSYRQKVSLSNLIERIKGFWGFNYTEKYDSNIAVKDFSFYGNNLALSKPITSFETGVQGLAPYIDFTSNDCFYANYVDSLKVANSFTIFFAGCFTGTNEENVILAQQAGSVITSDNWILKKTALGALKLIVYSDKNNYVTYTTSDGVVSLSPCAIGVTYDGNEANIFVNNTRLTVYKEITGQFTLLSTNSLKTTSYDEGETRQHPIHAKVSFMALIDACMTPQSVRALNMNLMALVGQQIYKGI